MSANASPAPLQLVWNVKGQQYKKVISHDQHFIIGRSRDCDIVVNDASMSRQHASVSTNEGHFHIHNLSKVNVVHVLSGAKVQTLAESEAHKLEVGSVFQIGNTRFAVHAIATTDKIFRLKCANCGKLSEPNTKDCPWCGASLSYGQSVFIDSE